MGREALLKAACMAVASVPFVAVVVCCVMFGIIRTISAVLIVAAVLVGCLIVVAFIRACGLELYERLFMKGDES